MQDCIEAEFANATNSQLQLGGNDIQIARQRVTARVFSPDSTTGGSETSGGLRIIAIKTEALQVVSSWRSPSWSPLAGRLRVWNRLLSLLQRP